jgi:hypothetical protein
MTHRDGLPDDASDHARRILRDKKVRASALTRKPPHKPSNWWVFEREPWKRINAEIMTRERADADSERADRALRSAFAFAGAALAMAHAPLPMRGDQGRGP